jgi:hypothetical protein
MDSDTDRIVDLLARLAAAEAAGLPASTVNGCPCDFCTGTKKYDDNWCFMCANVRMQPPKWWENADMCDQCEREMEIKRAAEAASP